MDEEPTNDLSFRYIAGNQLFAAALFSRLSYDIENDPPSTENNAHYFEITRKHMSYVMGAVMSSVAFLEATINELFSTATESSFGVGLSKEKTTRLAAVWKLDNVRQRAGILEKYQLALNLCDEQLFDIGKQPFQNTKLLIQLRNALVHYVPDPVVAKTTYEAAQELERKLKGKFNLNPFALTITLSIGKADQPVPTFSPRKVFFPDECLGHGCANWSVLTSLGFADEFCSKLGWEPPYEYVRSDLYL